MKESTQINLIPIYILSRKYFVPEGSTIITAMEYAGFKLKKGVGCREGFCGACATLYRLPNDYKLHGGLGCQTVVLNEMQIVQIPYTPSVKATYNIEEMQPEIEIFTKHYPELFRCLSCNTCTKICPQEIEVMDYVQASIKGDFEKAAELSFDCLACGLCGARCPAEISQFNVALLARRMYGRYLSKKGKFLDDRLKEINSGKYEDGYKELMNLTREEIKDRYFKREINFEIT